MRQIKFKGKRIDNGEWVIGYYYEFDERHFILDYTLNTYHISSVTQIRFEVDPDTVSQFTGLEDRNGKEVYENDIVSFPVKHKNLLVEWNDDLCVYQFSDGSLINSGDNYSAILFVIGNAFDNPELLNEKQ